MSIDATDPLSIPDNHAHLFVSAGFDRLECLTARFRTHHYARHVHETFVIGGIGTGCGTLFIRGQQRRASAGDLTLYNPDEVHDGGPGIEAGFGYRVSYPSLRLMESIAVEVSGGASGGTPCFRTPVVHDPAGLAAFARAHRTLESGGSSLAGEQSLFEAYARLLVHHAEIVPARLRRETGPIERVKQLIAERSDEDISLADLAAEARLSRFHLIRAFRRETGLTPHAYLVNRRIAVAKARLRAGDSLSQTAAASGFADQAHLTRAFKARIGVTPGAYRAAVAP